MHEKHINKQLCSEINNKMDKEEYNSNNTQNRNSI